MMGDIICIYCIEFMDMVCKERAIHHFYKEPFYKETTCRVAKYLKNLWYLKKIP